MERRESRAKPEAVSGADVRRVIIDARGKFASMRKGSGWSIATEGSVLRGVMTEPGNGRNTVTTSKIFINIDPEDTSGHASLELNIYRNLNGENHESRYYALSMMGLTVLNCNETVVGFDEAKQMPVKREIKGQKALAQTKNALQNLPGMEELPQIS